MGSGYSLPGMRQEAFHRERHQVGLRDPAFIIN